MPPIKCRLVEYPWENGRLKFELKPGDMYFAKSIIENEANFQYYRDNLLSPQYLNETMKRRMPLNVVLPNGYHFLVDKRCGDGAGGLKAEGWNVTGEPPAITVHPSINHQNITITHTDGREFHRLGYHGWLQEGVLSEDLEGRKYD